MHSRFAKYYLWEGWLLLVEYIVQCTVRFAHTHCEVQRGNEYRYYSFKIRITKLWLNAHNIPISNYAKRPNATLLSVVTILKRTAPRWDIVINCVE